MAFDNIYNFIFYDILKYEPSSSVLTGQLQNDVIFGLLIPTIFIAIVAHQGVHRIFGDSSKFVAYLSSLTSVGVIVTLGWVPIIAGIGGFVFVGLLALYFMYAFYRRIVSEGHEKAAYDIAGRIGDKVRDKIDYQGVTLTNKEMKEKYAHLRRCFERYNQEWNTYDSINKGLQQMTTQSTINTGGGSSNNAEANSLRSQATDVKKAMEDIAEQAIEIIKSVPRHERKKMIEDVRGHYNKAHLKELIYILEPWEEK